MLLADQLDPIAGLQLAPTPLLQLAIDTHIAPLDPEFGLAARAHQTLPFKKLIEAQLAQLLQGTVCGRVAVPAACPGRVWGGGKGQNNADSLP